MVQADSACEFNRVFKVGMIAAPGLVRHLRSLRLAVQDTALSRLKQGFDSPRERHIQQLTMPRPPDVAFCLHSGCGVLIQGRTSVGRSAPWPTGLPRQGAIRTTAIAENYFLAFGTDF